MNTSSIKNFDELPLFLNAQLVSRTLGVSPSSAYELLHEDGFPALRIGSRLVVPKEQFRLWVERQTGGAHEEYIPARPREPRVAAVSDFPGTAGRVPTGSPKPDTAPPCGSVGGKCSYWQERQRGKPLATNVGTRRNGQNRGILDAAARKQDKRIASEPTLFLFTTARSADCIKGLRRRCDWRLFGEK